uniref:Uncharacterized protein n=1 Tax=Oncorhynchus tshawytscha TaxID=74940 RepID=A0A8C8JMX3_ONCTS
MILSHNIFQILYHITPRVDLEKALDTLHRISLWKILHQFGIPPKIVNVIKTLYTDFHCQCLAKVFGPLELCDLLPHFRLQT